MRREYNEENRAIRFVYYLDEEPVINTSGYAIMTRTYDEAGLVTSEAYFGTAGEAVGHAKNKYHRIDRTWLDKKHATSEDWFDTEDQPMTNGNTYVRVEREFDAQLNKIAERYYGADGEPIACKDGYDEVHWAYGEDQKVTDTTYYLKGEVFQPEEVEDKTNDNAQ